VEYSWSAFLAGNHPVPKAVFNDYQRGTRLSRHRPAHPAAERQAIPGPPKEASGFLLAFEDVTERMEMERSLQASEQQFSCSLRDRSDSMLLVDRSTGRYIIPIGLRRIRWAIPNEPC